MMWGYGWGWWVVGAFMMLAFWGGLVAFGVLAIRSWGGPRDSTRGSRSSDASAILEERFARGEISKEEFVERKRILEGKAA